jgi:hypothetical protein
MERVAYNIKDNKLIMGDKHFTIVNIDKIIKQYNKEVKAKKTLLYFGISDDPVKPFELDRAIGFINKIYMYEGNLHVQYVIYDKIIKTIFGDSKEVTDAMYTILNNAPLICACLGESNDSDMTITNARFIDFFISTK